MAKTVTVKIAGPGNSGKKAIGELLAGILTAGGFEVEMEDAEYAESTLNEVAEVLSRVDREETTVVFSFEKTPAA